MQVIQFKCLCCSLCCRSSPLSLLPHEAIILQKIAERYQLNVVIKPSFIIWDSKNNIGIVLSYVLLLNNDVCVFLKGSKCTLQNTYKPLICRSFPFVPSYIRYFIDNKLKQIVHYAKYGLSSLCPFVITIKEQQLQSIALDNKQRELSIPTIFPDEYEAYYITEYLRMTYLSALSKLWQEDLIDVSLQSDSTLLQYVNAYYIVKPFVDIALLIIEKRAYLPIIMELLNIRTSKIGIKNNMDSMV